MSKTSLCCIVVTVLIVCVCFIGLNADIIRAEEVETENDSSGDVNYLTMLEDINNGVSDIKGILEDSRKQDENYYQQSINEQKILNDNVGGDYDIDGAWDSSSLYNDNNDVSEISTEDGEQVVQEEATTEVKEGEKNDDNAEDDPVQLENVTKQDILVLHSDLQKIMISIWALAGLMLGTKLISRMFGNG